MAVYSHSKITSYEKCPFKYKLRYIDKIKPLVEKTIESHLGNAVHDSFEWLYNNVKKGEIPTVEELIEHYANSWQRDYNQNILIVKTEFRAEDYFNKGAEFLINYYFQYHPFDDGTIECEKRITINLGENVIIYGFIDRLAHNKKTGEYEIHDYKTANTLPTRENIEGDKQLALYSIAIKELYGEDKEISLIWHYLAHNQKICLKKNKEELEELKRNILQTIREIEIAEEFPTRKSALCPWCEYKSICPEWN